METETQESTTYRPTAQETSAVGGNYAAKIKVNAKDGVMGRYGEDSTGKPVLIEKRESFIGLLKEWTHIPAYVFDRNTEKKTDMAPVEYSNWNDAKKKEHKELKLIKPRWIGTFETLDGGKEDLQMNADTWFFVSFVDILALWDRKSFTKFAIWIGDQVNADGGLICKANLYEFPEPGKCITLKSSVNNCKPDTAIDFLKSELGELYKEFKPKVADDVDDAMPWDGLNKVLASHGYEEFTGQPEYVEFIRAGLKLPTWDANNCTDWKPVEALCEKHHAKLPAAFLDPFFGE